MDYRYCGHSGLMLPLVSLGLWHNFGSVDSYDEAEKMIHSAFDQGVTHFDLANNYGPEPGSAETNFGRIVKETMAGHRDEMIISTKAGHDMWPGPYGDGSSRKNLMASIDQSLKRMQLDYVDIFYSHRYDGVTPVEETMQALIDIVHQGKALYVGISKYPAELQQKCYDILREAHVPCLISQYRASMYDTSALKANLPVATANGSGFICFSPLAQGLLTDRYLNGIPEDSRAAKATGFLQLGDVTPERVEASRKLKAIAEQRGQTLPQMALAWLLDQQGVTSVIVGASSVRQLNSNLEAAQNIVFSAEERAAIAAVLADERLQME